MKQNTKVFAVILTFITIVVMMSSCVIAEEAEDTNSNATQTPQDILHEARPYRNDMQGTFPEGEMPEGGSFRGEIPQGGRNMGGGMRGGGAFDQNAAQLPEMNRGENGVSSIQDPFLSFVTDYYMAIVSLVVLALAFVFVVFYKRKSF